MNTPDSHSNPDSFELQTAPVEGNTPAEAAPQVPEAPSGTDPVKSANTLSRTDLISVQHQLGGGPSECPLHELALKGRLDKGVLKKLSKMDGAAAGESGLTALIKALLTEAAALPLGDFPGKTMNAFGASAAGGHLAQIPEECFTKETLLHLSGDHSVHFLIVAKHHNRLSEVPAFLWSRLQRWQGEALSEKETQVLAELLKIHAEVIAAQRAHELKYYQQNATPFEHLPQRFQQGEDAFHAWSRPWIKLLGSDTVSFDRIPPRLQQNQEALEAWARPWIHKLATEPVPAYQIPPQLRNDPKAIAARKQFHCGLIEKGDEKTLRSVPEDLRQEPDVRDAVIKGWSSWLAARGKKSWSALPADLRSEGVLIEQVASLWLHSIETETVSWPEIPDEVRALEHIRRAWLGRQKLPVQMPDSLAEVSAQPNITKGTLDLWRHSNQWNRQRASATLIELRSAPWHFAHLNAAAQTHKLIHKAAHDGVCDLIRQHWAYFQITPDALKADPEVQDLAATGFLEGLQANQITWEQVPEELRAAPTLVDWRGKQDAKERKHAREEKQAKVASRVLVDPKIRDEDLTRKELKNAGIRKLRAAYWTKRILEDKNQFLEVPESLLDVPAVQAAVGTQWGPVVRQNPAEFDSLPERVRADAGIQRVYKIATRPPESE